MCHLCNTIRQGPYGIAIHSTHRGGTPHTLDVTFAHVSAIRFPIIRSSRGECIGECARRGEDTAPTRDTHAISRVCAVLIGALAQATRRSASVKGICGANVRNRSRNRSHRPARTTSTTLVRHGTPPSQSFTVVVESAPVAVLPSGARWRDPRDPILDLVPGNCEGWREPHRSSHRVKSL